MPLLFRRLHEKFDQIDATVERNTLAFERHEQAFQDFREAFRQDRLRSERMFREMFLAIGEMREDIREDIRAHTKAIQSLLDRLGEGPTPAS